MSKTYLKSDHFSGGGSTISGVIPLEVRKATLANILARATHGIWFNDHIEEEDGETVFRHACELGLEGIVSKRKDSPYRSGRSPDWLEMKNPACAAVKREEEEEWGRK
jgi:bifunctional non-homologous end joining protein LigD